MWSEANGVNTVIGDSDATLKWCKKFVAPVPVETPALTLNVDKWNADHGFEYDLVVIGGGSGGLSTAREAAKLGAKVACLISLNHHQQDRSGASVALASMLVASQRS